MSVGVYLPEKIWLTIVAFLKAGKDGEIVLKVHKGNIFKLDVTETITV
jgi:hypothetical protein